MPIAGLPGKRVRKAIAMSFKGLVRATKKADSGGKPCDDREPLARVRSVCIGGKRGSGEKTLTDINLLDSPCWLDGSFVDNYQGS